MLVLLTWGLSGLGAVGGSILGSAGGKRGLFVGAALGGAAAAASSAWLASRLRLIAPGRVRGAALGGLIGFAAAAPLAALNLHTPVIPVLCTGLTGIGALVGGRYLGASRG